MPLPWQLSGSQLTSCIESKVNKCHAAQVVHDSLLAGRVQLCLTLTSRQWCLRACQLVDLYVLKNYRAAYPNRMFAAAQNVSSVQCYLWDISLLYAQRRDNIELAKQISHLQVHILCTCRNMQLHPSILL